jgi:hypothetical protein
MITNISDSVRIVGKQAKGYLQRVLLQLAKVHLGRLMLAGFTKGVSNGTGNGSQRYRMASDDVASDNYIPGCTMANGFLHCGRSKKLCSLFRDG